MRAKNVGFVVLTALLVCVILFCVGGTVEGQEKPGEKALENWYQAKEEELLRETRAYLNSRGFQNCGVTLTRVVDEEGMREYTFTIHHGRIDRMEEPERQALKEQLEASCGQARDAFPEAGCSFRYTFLLPEQNG